MKTLKPIVVLLAAFTLTAHLEAQDEGDNNKKEQKDKNKEKEKRAVDRKERREAVKAVLDAKDGNNDGSLTKDEFLSDETDKEAASKRFDQFNKNGDRYLTKGEIEDLLGFQ